MSTLSTALYTAPPRLSEISFPTDLTFVQNVLTVSLHDYTVMQTKELPSNEVLNNDNIIRHYMATKKMEGLSIKTLKTL